jgi:hypothetical protein
VTCLKIGFSRLVESFKPNQLFSQVLSYAADNTKGNRSEAIVELIELGLAVALRQQSTRSEQTVQDSVS